LKNKEKQRKTKKNKEKPFCHIALFFKKSLFLKGFYRFLWVFIRPPTRRLNSSN